MPSNFPAVLPDGFTSARRRAIAEKQLRRFAARHRTAVRALAAQHERISDLAVSFPALLFALAVPRNGFSPDTSIACTIAGRQIKELARLAALPLWSRRLSPEAFQRPIEELPDGDLISRQIVNHLPRSPKLAPRWLEAVSFGLRWGAPSVAVWIARELTRDAKSVTLKQIRLICLYAWYSGQPHTLGASMITKPWQR
jgi:hypothetical protein